jgi:hypothetical protein
MAGQKVVAVMLVRIFVQIIPASALIQAQASTRTDGLYRQVQSSSVQQPRKVDGPTKPRMAVCIVGAGRTLPSSVVYESIPTISSTSDAQGLLQGHADLFVHVSVGASNMSKMRAAIDHLQPAKYVLEDGHGPYPTDEGVQKYLANPGCYRQFWEGYCGLGKAMNYQHHIKSCYSLVEGYEAETKLQYDVIMFARSDLQWLAAPPATVIRAAVPGLSQVNGGMLTSQWDVWMVVPRRVAYDVAGVLTDYYTARCDFRGTRTCDKKGCYDTIPEEITKDAVAVSVKRHDAEVDYTSQYDNTIAIVRPWDIPKDSFRAADDDEEYLEELHGRQRCKKGSPMTIERMP